MTIRVRGHEVEEDVTSQIGGGNTDFTASYPFRRGTVRMELNGQDVGFPGGRTFDELNDTTVRFRTTGPSFVPVPDDVLILKYVPL